MEKDIGYRLEGLRIYQLACELADAVWEIVSQWDWFAKSTVCKQLVEASDSIGANISEGYGRHPPREDLTFLYYARGSLKETEYWIERVVKRQLMQKQAQGQLKAVIENLEPQLNSYIASVRRKANNK